MTGPENGGAKQGGRFQKGRSGNPAGKPKGARHRATLAAEALLDGEAEELTRKAVELALAGDVIALRLCLDRILSPRRERPVTFGTSKNSPFQPPRKSDSKLLDSERGMLAWDSLASSI